MGQRVDGAISRAASAGPTSQRRPLPEGSAADCGRHTDSCASHGGCAWHTKVSTAHFLCLLPAAVAVQLPELGLAPRLHTAPTHTASSSCTFAASTCTMACAFFRFSIRLPMLPKGLPPPPCRQETGRAPEQSGGPGGRRAAVEPARRPAAGPQFSQLRRAGAAQRCLHPRRPCQRARA